MRVARALGGAAGSTLALGLLVCSCVTIAVAGPSLSLRLRTNALHQTLGQLGPPGTSVAASTQARQFMNDLTGVPVLAENDLSATTSAIGDGLASKLPIGTGAWGGLTTKPHEVVSGTGRLPTGVIPELEVTYRYPLPGSVRLVAGQLTRAPIPGGALAVTVTEQTSARYGMHPGSRLSLDTPGGQVRLLVTGVVREREPASTFWTADPLAASPHLITFLSSPPILEGAVLVDPGQLLAMQDAFCKPAAGYCDDLRLLWEYPIVTGGVTADQAKGLYNGLTHASATLTAKVGGAATDLAISSPLTSTLATFIATQTAILAVLLLLFVSVIAMGMVAIVLTGRMLMTRREREMRTLHARGASGQQVALLVLRGVALGAVPGALAGAALGSLTSIGSGTLPGGTAGLGWELAAATLTVALAAPVTVASWRHHKSSPVVRPARILTAETFRQRLSGPRLRQLTASITACAAAVGGLYVLHQQGVPAGATNWFLTVAPVLAAAPAALLAVYLYPVAVRGLLWVFRRGTGATSYVAFAGAARRPVINAAPGYALVLALTVAAFGGMVRDGIIEGQGIASWQVTGADAVIRNGPAAAPITPAMVRAVAAVPGVRQTAAVWQTTWDTPGGTQLSTDAVDPAAYQALTRDTPFPAFPAGALDASTQPAGPTTVVSVLASPHAAAALGAGSVQITSATGLAEPILVRVTGTLPDTPAEPAGGDFLLMPLRALPGAIGRPAPNMLLAAGPDIDQARLNGVVSRMLPGAVVTYRTAAYTALRDAPLPRAGVLMILLCVSAAAVLGIGSLIVGLTLSAHERRLTLARLSVMGYSRHTWFALLGGLPAVLMAIAAAAACVFALPGLIGPALDLSAFTGSDATVPLQPGLATFGGAAAITLLVAGAALVAESRRSRGSGITGVLRAE
ncbi:MAG TPA: hypothetical protein VF070_33560 [Streptosporangiaceae bacterium]